LAGIDTAIRLTNSPKAEFIVHPATGGTSSGQKREEFTTLFTRGDGLSAFLYIFHLSVLYCEHATLWHIIAGDSIIKFRSFSLLRALTISTAWGEIF